MALASKRTIRHDLSRHVSALVYLTHAQCSTLNYSQLTNGVEAACCDDRAALKSGLPSFLLFDTKKTLDPAIATSGNKADRGFNHPDTAALLCPITLPATKLSVMYSHP